MIFLKTESHPLKIVNRAAGGRIFEAARYKEVRNSKALSLTFLNATKVTITLIRRTYFNPLN